MDDRDLIRGTFVEGAIGYTTEEDMMRSLNQDTRVSLLSQMGMQQAPDPTPEEQARYWGMMRNAWTPPERPETLVEPWPWYARLRAMLRRWFYGG